MTFYEELEFNDGIFYGHGDWTFDEIHEILTF